MSDPGPTIETFGCRLNLAESETIRELAGAAGLSQVVIVHSCAVTAAAERQARQSVARARRDHPEVPVIVTGCAATLRPAEFAALPGVVRVLDNREKLDPAAWRALAGTLGRVPAPAPVAPRTGTTRGFVAVQRGCDHRCTFCVIPQARGASRSEPIDAVVATINGLVERGRREIVLTGVDLTAWGRDLPGGPGLGSLVRAILQRVPGLPRLRLSSLDPAEIDETLWAVFGTAERLMPHLHFSAQSGDDLVLKQMRRRHARTDLLAAAGRARALRPEAALGADFIAGFPTETEAQFDRTLSLVDEAGLDYLHVFPYSPRAGTPASRLRALPGPVVAARAAALRARGAGRLARRLDSLVGRSLQVLVEQGGTGHAECFARVRPDEPVAAGTIVRVRAIGVAGDHLMAQAA